MLPFSFNQSPISMLFDNEKKMIVAQKNKFYQFGLYSTPWSHERLIWIAFYKNKDNEKCIFNKLYKDLVRHIGEFLSSTSFTFYLQSNGKCNVTQENIDTFTKKSEKIICSVQGRAG